MQMEYSGNCHMKKAYKIAEFFCNNITTQFQIERKSIRVHEKRSHAVRSFMDDSSLDFIRNLKPIKVDGLYAFDDYGKKITPHTIFFGIDTRLFRPIDGEACGYAYFHYLNALRPVFMPDGRHYREPYFCNVCGKYKDGFISDFYRE